MVIGITGGVGCGKSTVLTILNEKYSAYIIDADKTAHKLMEPDGTAYRNITEYFGKDIMTDNGFIDRKKLGQIVFNNKAKLEKLNSFVHPAVKLAITDEIELAKAKEDDLIIAVEAALFIEAGYMDICDELWYIYTDNEVRIKRIMETRGYTRTKAESIIANQLSEEEFRKYANVVIDNSFTIENTQMQIKERLSSYGR